jgi:signal transduction histidine kinase
MTIREHEAGIHQVAGQVDSSYGEEASPYTAPRRRVIPQGMTIRLRMTVAYGASAFITGVALILTTYYLVRWRLFHPAGDIVEPPGCPAPAHSVQRLVEYCAAQRNKQALQQIDRTLILVLLVAAALAVVMGYVLARRFLRPLHRITQTARKVTGRPDRGLHARIDLDGPHDELMELAQTFDMMLDRLDRAFEAQRRFVGNASHELRTPLAINRTLLEVTMTDPAGSCARPCSPPTSAARR